MGSFLNRRWLSPLLWITVLSTALHGVPLYACCCSSSGRDMVRNTSETSRQYTCCRVCNSCPKVANTRDKHSCCQPSSSAEGRPQSKVNTCRCHCGRLLAAQPVRLTRGAETVSTILNFCHQITMGPPSSIACCHSPATWNRWAAVFGFPPLLSGAERCVSLCRLTI